jgi:hypothetical protein
MVRREPKAPAAAGWAENAPARDGELKAARSATVLDSDQRNLRPTTGVAAALNEEENYYEKPLRAGRGGGAEHSGIRG